jgi:hypothetical protein
MKRRKFLGCLAATAVAKSRLAWPQSSAAQFPAAPAVKIKVEPDDRVHDRIFPPPPITEVVDKIPHNWLTSFEDLESWDISMEGAEDPRVRRCRYRPLFRPTHVEISWAAMKDGKIRLLPPQPLRLPPSWNAIDFWVGGEPLDYSGGPLYEVTFHFVDTEGKDRQFEVCEKTTLHRRYAIDMFHRLVPKKERQNLAGGALKAIEIRVPKKETPWALQLYAPTFYTYDRKRSYQQPARLPFPTHPDGIVPTPLTAGTVAVEETKGENATRFSFKAADGTAVVYTYSPQAGTLDDVTVSVDGGAAFRPCAGGGVVLEGDGTRLTPPYKLGEAKLVSQKLEAGRLTANWEARAGTQTIRYALSFRMVNRSLIAEAQVEGSRGVEMRIGYADYPGAKRPIEVPMLTWYFSRPKPSNDYDLDDVALRKGGRARSPAVLLAGDTFLSAIFDWYVSEASFLYPTAEEKGAAKGYDGGAYYMPVIDGERNPLREKLILTVSKDFQEVLPNIPNPPSPYRELMRERVYAHGEIRGLSAALQKNLGIRHVATLAQLSNAYCDYGACRPSQDMGDINDWIDNPSRLHGGIDGLVRRAEQFRAIGWLIGTYVNYALMNPMFRVAAELPSAHDVNGFHRSIWNASTVPYQGDAIAYARRQLTKMKKICGFQLLYADQTTAYSAYDFTDYTPGVPGAGKFREAYEQIAQLYLTMKEVCNGPTYSEGGLHWTYSGMIDGNLARTQHLPPTKWPGPPPADLVDFQLLKINPLSVDVCSNDYFDNHLEPVSISQTLAYGKLGLWYPHTGQGPDTLAMSARAYYVHHHAQRHFRDVPVEKILYHDGKELVSTTGILNQGKERMGRIYVRYRNGFESWTNLNPKEPWPVRVGEQDWLLPPYGWFQRRKEAWGEFRNYSVVREGEGRRWYVEDDGMLMVSAPGNTVRFVDIETDGTAIVRREAKGGSRVINIDAQLLRVRGSRLGLKPETNQAILQIFDLEGTPVKDDKVSVEQGWVDFSFLAQEQFALVLP